MLLCAASLCEFWGSEQGPPACVTGTLLSHFYSSEIFRFAELMCYSKKVAKRIPEGFERGLRVEEHRLFFAEE